MSISRKSGASAPENHPFVSDTNLLDYQEADRRWFERHPTRNYRFRPPYIGEPFAPPGFPISPAPPGFLVHVLVTQLAPGIRTRVRIVHSEQPTAAMMNDDAWIAAVYQWWSAS